jgi:hypothetical protein
MSMPEFADEMLKWAGTNKDALLALGAFLAAFLAPVTAIIAAAVSYRAVVTGPRVQMRIAQQQNELAERQQALHEKQFELTKQQLRFAIFGASEQKWISDFQEMLGYLFDVAFRSSIIRGTLQKLPELNTELVELQNEAVALISRIWIHLGRDMLPVKPDSEFASNDELDLQNKIAQLRMKLEASRSVRTFVEMLRSWFFPEGQFDYLVWARQQEDIVAAALQIISEHEAKIGFNQIAPGPEEQRKN